MVRVSSKTPVAPIVVSAVVVEKVEKVEKKKRVKKEVVEEPVVEPPVEVVPEKTNASEALSLEMDTFNKNYQQWLSFGNLLKANVKNIAKLSSRISKCADKTSRKRKSSNAKSGFEQPTLISDELAVFFGKAPGTRMARTEVSKQIHEYVKANNLQNVSNRRIIQPDAKLRTLLNSQDDELTYFNLQRYLKIHFQKEVAK